MRRGLLAAGSNMDGLSANLPPDLPAPLCIKDHTNCSYARMNFHLSGHTEEPRRHQVNWNGHNALHMQLKAGARNLKSVKNHGDTVAVRGKQEYVPHNPGRINSIVSNRDAVAVRGKQEHVPDEPMQIRLIKAAARINGSITPDQALELQRYNKAKSLHATQPSWNRVYNPNAACFGRVYYWPQ